MAIVEKGIQVSVYPAGMQDTYGTEKKGIGLVYPLKGMTTLPGASSRTDVVFLFPTTNYEPPKNVRERLSGQKVQVHGVAWVEGEDDYLVAPTPSALRSVTFTRTDRGVIPVPETLRQSALQDLTRQTHAWFNGFTLRGVFETWDAHRLLDPQRHTLDSQNDRALDLVTETMVRAVASRTIDPAVGQNLIDEVIIPGRMYVKWLDNLRDKDGEVFSTVLDRWPPRQLHQALYDLTTGQDKVINGPLSRVLTDNPYDLGTVGAQYDKEVGQAKHSSVLKFLQTESERYRAGSPERSLLARLGITTQLAKEYAAWFHGRTAEDSEILTEMTKLREEAPIIPALLRAMEITTEGQQFSEHLRTKLVNDPQQESYKAAA